MTGCVLSDVAAGRRPVQRVNLAVCADGHATAISAPELAWQIQCRREHWTWEDGNYCVHCGVKL